jgi:CDP-glucose 4,6-dehydratase
VKIAALVLIDPDFWRSRRVLVTGHTGFKGAWLSLWLQSLGAHVTGVARDAPTRPSLFALARVGEHMTQHPADVRDARAVQDALRGCEPEVIFHLAAQPMVRRSLREPALTYEVNVMGTVNVLEAVRRADAGVRAVVVVTSDKCYENDGSPREGFLEDDRLGGRDPYSSSKACAELVAAAYRDSFFTGTQAPGVATARAGNVIGGGDWGEDRLLADAVRAVASGAPLRLRNPEAVRPWQHVLAALGGYLLLAQELCERPELARAWNFGPPAGDARSVGWVVERLASLWDGALSWERDERPAPSEAPFLALDSSAAERELRWRAPWGLEDSLALIVAWHRAHLEGREMRSVSLAQLDEAGAAAPDRAGSRPQGM